MSTASGVNAGREYPGVIKSFRRRIPHRDTGPTRPEPSVPHLAAILSRPTPWGRNCSTGGAGLVKDLARKESGLVLRRRARARWPTQASLSAWVNPRSGGREGQCRAQRYREQPVPQATRACRYCRRLASSSLIRRGLGSIRSSCRGAFESAPFIYMCPATRTPWAEPQGARG